MIVDVKMPDFETRLAILQERCQESQVIMNPQVLEFIAYNSDRSIRMLEGVLRPVSFIEKDATPRTVVTLERLLDSAAEYFTIPKSDVAGDSRVRECMIPRQ